MKLMIYEGYELEDSPLGYRCLIDGEYVKFKKVTQWKEHIDKLLASRAEKEKHGPGRMPAQKN